VTQDDQLAVTRGADRPRSHGGTTETEMTIFAATERLLADLPLREISVAQIIRAAGISRATFYFYFSSKFAVLSGLLARIMDEIFEVITPFTERRDGVAPGKALQESLSAAIGLWGSHRPALRAVHEHWSTTEELGALWISVIRRYTDAVAREIDRERAEGLARPGVDSHQLAATLLWATEACLSVAGLGVDENLPDEESVLAPLMALWVGGLGVGVSH